MVREFKLGEKEHQLICTMNVLPIHPKSIVQKVILYSYLDFVSCERSDHTFYCIDYEQEDGSRQPWHHDKTLFTYHSYAGKEGIDNKTCTSLVTIRTHAHAHTRTHAHMRTRTHAHTLASIHISILTHTRRSKQNDVVANIC
jgi:hypothetical protein